MVLTPVELQIFLCGGGGGSEVDLVLNGIMSLRYSSWWTRKTSVWNHHLVMDRDVMSCSIQKKVGSTTLGCLVHPLPRINRRNPGKKHGKILLHVRFCVEDQSTVFGINLGFSDPFANHPPLEDIIPTFGMQIQDSAMLGKLLAHLKNHGTWEPDFFRGLDSWCCLYSNPYDIMTIGVGWCFSHVMTNNLSSKGEVTTGFPRTSLIMRNNNNNNNITKENNITKRHIPWRLTSHWILIVIPVRCHSPPGVLENAPLPSWVRVLRTDIHGRSTNLGRILSKVRSFSIGSDEGGATNPSSFGLSSYHHSSIYLVEDETFFSTKH